nr:beta-hydroxyacyl-ACp dehydratase (FABZ) [Polytomella parva]|eukprot:CAMPEP_0175062822 /NCGR_PEP_ID=MMETSP0052_2-20121109/14389_1 /TAXON_ID=51329 ORGANISM="Polytomella parva, Strain SAG 63-3" /NCGR_SAMPLE_ID=MMETSP0052_2 /ASSEMBLY_ACC=CAM_ASM_000194 /LENGTH=195 /DNA_ID=CAMNT_0016328901 /DNA_START=85 /DNA_END=672 /DNA_ORIENTATION=+
MTPARPVTSHRLNVLRPIGAAKSKTPAKQAAPAGPASVEKNGPNFKALRDINQIMQTLPHRYPFLLVDRVVDWQKEKFAVGYKCVTANDNFFPGHFPERPIMPGVLQVEAMAQLAGLSLLDPEDKAAKGLFFFGGIDNCKFRKPVVPGDVLMMRTDITKFNKRFGMVKVDAKGYVGDELVVEAELTLVMTKGEAK